MTTGSPLKRASCLMLRASVKPSISGISRSVSTIATRSRTVLPSAFALWAMGVGVERGPVRLAGFEYFVGRLQRLELLLDQRARDERIVCRQDDSAGLERQFGAHFFCGDLMVVRG